MGKTVCGKFIYFYRAKTDLRCNFNFTSCFMFCDDQKCAHDRFEEMMMMMMRRRRQNNVQAMNSLEGEILKFLW